MLRKKWEIERNEIILVVVVTHLAYSNVMNEVSFCL